MDLHFDPVTDENRACLLALSLFPEQLHNVESVAECLKEAACDSRWHPVGIFDGEQPVGFAMFGAFDERGETRVWLDRLLIDRGSQKKGYGTAVLTNILPKLAAFYHTDRIYLSVFEGNEAAEKLYAKFGFHRTGELDFSGEHIMVCRIS